MAVRHVDDPYLVAARLTGGSLDFGESAASLRMAGVAVTVVGVLLLLCCTGLGYLVHSGDGADKAPLHGASADGWAGGSESEEGRGEDVGGSVPVVVSPIVIAATGSTSATAQPLHPSQAFYAGGPDSGAAGGPPPVYYPGAAVPVAMVVSQHTPPPTAPAL